MSHLECLSLIYIATQAHTNDGTWIGSAGALAGEIGINARTARDILENLDKKGYVKRWPVPGRHLCYPIRVHKYPTTTGEHDGDLVDALSSAGPADYRWLPAESRQQHGEENVEHNAQRGGKLSAAQKRIENGELRIETNSNYMAGPVSPNQKDFNSNSKVKTKSEPKTKYHWEWFSRLHEHLFGVAPTAGKKQRNTYEKLCRKDGEDWVLLAFVNFWRDNINHGWDDPSAAGWGFLNASEEDYRFDARSKADADPRKSDYWDENEAAPFFAEWFGISVAGQPKAASAGKNR